MSDWNQYPDWNPLGWAQLTANNQQNINQGFTHFLDQSLDFLKQKVGAGYELSNAKDLASFQKGLPMSPFEQAQIGVQTRTADVNEAFREAEQKHYDTIEKINADATLSAEKRAAAQLEEDKRWHDMQLKIAEMQGGSGTATAAQLDAQSAAMGKLLQQWATTHSYVDPTTGQTDWNAMRGDVEKIVKLIPSYLASAGLDRASAKDAENYLRQLLAGDSLGGGTTGLNDIATGGFPWPQAKESHPSAAGAISGGFGSGESVLGKIISAFGNAPSVGNMQNAGVPSGRSLTDYEYRRTRGGQKILVNKKTGLAATAEDIRWYKANGGT